MTPQELQSKVLDYLSKHIDTDYRPRVEVIYDLELDVFFIDVSFVCEIKADKEDVYHPDQASTTYAIDLDDLTVELEYLASEIRSHKIEDNRRYDETGASY